MENSNTTTLSEPTGIKPRKGWKIAIIGLSVAFVCAAGAFVFFAVKYNDGKNELNSIISSQHSAEDECPETTTDTPTDEPAEEPTVPEANTRQYLAINEWGVKIEITRGLVNYGIMYKLEDFAGTATVVFYVTQEPALVGKPISYLTRGKTCEEARAETSAPDCPKIGDFYYAFSGPIGRLTSNDTDLISETTVLTLMSVAEGTLTAL